MIILKKNELQKKYNKLLSKKNLSEEDLNNKYILLNDIDKYTCLIESIENNKEEDEYLLNVGNILFEYYNTDTDISNIDNDVSNETEYLSNNSLLKYFNNNTTNVSTKGNYLMTI